MKKDQKIVIICIIIYAINRVTKNYFDIPIVSYICRCYLSDFLGGILFPAYTNYILKKANKKTIEKYYQLFFYMLIVGILWEYFFPIFITYSVTDNYDILCYLLGATFYYFIKRRIKNERNEQQQNQF